VRASEGYESSHSAELGACRRLNWALFPYRSITNSSWITLVPVLGAAVFGGVQWTVQGDITQARDFGKISLLLGPNR